MSRRAYALDQLRSEIDAAFPGRDIRSDGWIGDAAHRDRKSDHNPNDAGVVCAIDVDEHTDRSERSEAVGRWLVERLRKSQDPRIKYVIYEGRMFSSYSMHGVPPWTWRTGSGHDQHVHVSVNNNPSHYDNRRPWFQEEDDMSPDQAKMLREVHEQLTSLDPTTVRGALVGDRSGLKSILDMARKIRATQVERRKEA